MLGRSATAERSEKPCKNRSVAMMKLMTRMTTVILVLILALPTVGCQQKDKEKEEG